MNRRIIFTLAAVGFIALTAGCLGSSVDDEAFAEEKEYDWNVSDNVDADLTLEEGGWIGSSRFEAVYRIDGTSEVELYRESFTRDSPLSVEALQFKTTSGDVYTYADNPDQFEYEESGGRLHITLPEEDGKLAFTATRSDGQLSIPAYVEGTYHVELPEGYRVGDFLLSSVSPSQSDETIDEANDTMSLHIEGVDSSLSLRFYTPRTQMLFWSTIAVLGVTAIGGFFYFKRRIRQITEWRREQGLDVETDDEDQGPPKK